MATTCGLLLPDGCLCRRAHVATRSHCHCMHGRWEPLTGDCGVDCLTGCRYPGQFSECDVPS